MTDGEQHPDGTIRLSSDGPLRLLCIDRPAKLNGFTPKMLGEMAHALTAIERDPDARVTLVHAMGKHFTAGLDLPKVSEAWSRGEEIYPKDALDLWNLRPPYRTKPVVVAVKGICFTVGVEFALSADIVVAADDCRFSQLEVRRGIMAAGGATIRMVQRAGWGNAMRYLLTGDEWDAATALRLGFVQEVVPSGQEFDRAYAVAKAIAADSAPLAVTATLTNARKALEGGTLAAVGEFDAIRTRLRGSDDATEGVRSFVEKRPPRFSGR